MSEECRNSDLQEMDLKTGVNVIVELRKQMENWTSKSPLAKAGVAKTCLLPGPEVIKKFSCSTELNMIL